MLYHRIIQSQIESWFFKKKILILYGARQVGKTTLVKAILENHEKQNPNKTRYINCEMMDTQLYFSEANPYKIKAFLGDYSLIILDEAQKIKNIGLMLKLLIDEYPDLQIIATGSSSFDLANQVSEPLTGRSITFQLFPFAVQELKQQYDNLHLQSQLENLLILGSYPEVFTTQLDSFANAEILLNNLASNYLYKDLLILDQIKKSEILIKLLKLLALQIGSIVSCHELATTLKISSQTVERYLDLLEKAFIIFKLRAFNRNLRKEIGKAFKIYFYDLGIRNSIINNFNPMELRSGNEIGGLWENFCLIERMKYNALRNYPVNSYFWRTYDQQEIDYIEEAGGVLNAFEFKFKINTHTKIKPPKAFLENYQNSHFKIIHSENIWDFVS